MICLRDTLLLYKDRLMMPAMLWSYFFLALTWCGLLSRVHCNCFIKPVRFYTLCVLIYLQPNFLKLFLHDRSHPGRCLTIFQNSKVISKTHMFLLAYPLLSFMIHILESLILVCFLLNVMFSESRLMFQF